MAGKYTPQGLPIPSLDTLRTFGRDMIVRGQDQAKEWLKLIDQENPGVGTYIAAVGRRYKGTDRVAVMEDLAGLYMVMRRQAKSNKLGNILNYGENTIQTRGLLRLRKTASTPSDIHAREDLVKVYAFAEDFYRIYGDIVEALVETSSVLGRNPSLVTKDDGSPKFMYGIAFPWGYVEHGGPVRKVDFYGFEFDGSWEKCNPEYRSYVFKNGVYQPDDTNGCETGSIILGKEGEHRRAVVESKGDVEDYLMTWPDIGRLGPIDDNIHILSTPASF